MTENIAPEFLNICTEIIRQGENVTALVETEDITVWNSGGEKVFLAMQAYMNRPYYDRNGFSVIRAYVQAEENGVGFQYSVHKGIPDEDPFHIDVGARFVLESFRNYLLGEPSSEYAGFIPGTPSILGPQSTKIEDNH